MLLQSYYKVITKLLQSFAPLLKKVEWIYIMSIDIIDTFNSNDGTNYVISQGMMTFSFALEENPDCFIEFTIENINLLKIDLFKCSSAPGTGRVLMYNLFDYLIKNNLITYLQVRKCLKLKEYQHQIKEN